MLQRLTTSAFRLSPSTAHFFSSSSSYSTKMADAPFYSLSCNDISGKPFSFEALKGKIVVIVNVASKCGFTGQYSGLQKLYEDYKDKGVEIIGFPCNQFGGQEPGKPEEIVEFCSRTYSVNFPIMEKVDVNGDKTHPVYAYLKSQKKSLFMEAIKWNFEKFLVDRDGSVVERFTSAGTPEHIRKSIDQLLAKGQ